MNKLKVVYMGTPEFSIAPLEGIYENYDVIAVVTQPDKEKGRSKELSFSPVKEFALKHGIKVLQPVKIRNEYEDVINLNPDIIITCAYGQIIPEVILNAPKYGCINIHASLLPKYRGGAPIHRAVINGDKKTGVTIMYMDKGMDSGDIIKQRDVEITDDMNTSMLHDKLSVVGRELILEVLPTIIDGTNDRIKQDESEVSFAKIIKREDEVINFDDTTINVYNKIRGLSEYPGAYVSLDGVIYKVYASRKSSFDKDVKCGVITNIYKDGIGVKTKDGEIVLLDIKKEGKRRMLASVYLNGVKKEELLGKCFDRVSYEV